MDQSETSRLLRGSPGDQSDRDAELRSVSNFHRQDLTLSCGCKWSFVSYRFYDECDAHRQPKQVITINAAVDVTDGGRHTAD